MSKTSTKFITLCLLTTGLSSAVMAGSARHMPSLLPSNPNAGECYARVEIPAQYRSDKETVMVEGAHAELQVTEPELRSRQEQVVVKEASVRYAVRQPTYRSITDQVMIRPSYERLSVTRPQFETVTETIQVSKPRLTWKKGNPATLRAQGYVIRSTADAGRAGRGYRSTTEYGQARAQASLCGPSCEVWCLVEAPETKVSYNRKVMTSPGTVQRIVVPAKFSTITKQVVTDPGGVKEIPVPAQYRSITVEDVVKPASVRQIKSPPKYSQVEKKVLLSPERYEWRRVLCAPGTLPPVSRSHQPRTVASQSGYVAAPVHQSRTYGQSVASSASSYHSQSGHVASKTVPHSYGNHSSHYAVSSHVTSSQTLASSASSLGLRGSQPAQTVTGTHYYGSDLPTYSEDYTQPSTSKRRRRR